MTLLRNTFEGGTDGVGITTGNSGGASGTAFSSVNTTYCTYSTSAALNGAMGMLVSSTSAQATASWTISSTHVAAHLMFNTPTLPGADTHLIRFNAGGTRLVSVHINSANRLRVSDATGTTGVWTSTNAISTNTTYRLELYVVCGSSTSNGTIKFAYYLGNSSTPVETAYLSTTANVGTAQTITTVTLGRFTANTIQMKFDELAAEDSASDFIGPVNEPLDTPVVTITGTSNPSTIGGTNGSITVSWPDVDGADHYRAGIADGNVSSGFVEVDDDVTSPYTFTGLEAGEYTVAIQAMAS